MKVSIETLTFVLHHLRIDKLKRGPMWQAETREKLAIQVNRKTPQMAERQIYHLSSRLAHLHHAVVAPIFGRFSGKNGAGIKFHPQALAVDRRLKKGRDRR